jgi:Lrp/AsnC family transcriptional regulator
MSGYDALYQQLIQADLFDVSASFVMEALKQTTELPIPRA